MPLLDQVFERSTRDDGPPAFSTPACISALVVATTAAGAFVICPNYDMHLRWGPCLPANANVNVGDAVSIAFDEDGQPWLVGSQGPQGAQGPPGPPGWSNAVYTDIWTWTTKTADAANSGQVGINATSWASATQINLNEKTTVNRDATLAFAKIAVGDELLLQQKTDATRWAKYAVTSAPTDQGAWWSWPVSFETGGGNPPGGNADTTVSLLKQGPPPGQLSVVFATTVSFTAGANQFVVENYNGGTVFLPANPAVGDVVVVDAYHAAGVVTVMHGNGKQIWWNGAGYASLGMQYQQTIRATSTGSDWRTEHN